MIDDALSARGLEPARIAAHITTRFGLAPRFGIEREFYLRDGNAATFALLAPQALAAATSLFLHCEPETGASQFEYALNPGDVDHVTASVRAADAILAQIARQMDGSIDWAAMPFLEQPPSGMHVHISLHDANGHNHFAKPGAAIDSAESPVLLAVVGGLLDTLRPLIAAFAPTPDCYRRLVQLPYPDVQCVPTTLSWGADNRSVALRLPPSGRATERRRIEHRVASAAAPIDTVLSAILIGIWAGLDSGQPPAWPKTPGLANNPALCAPRLPTGSGIARRWYADCGEALLDRLAVDLADPP